MSGCPPDPRSVGRRARRSTRCDTSSARATNEAAESYILARRRPDAGRYVVWEGSGDGVERRACAVCMLVGWAVFSRGLALREMAVERGPQGHGARRKDRFLVFFFKQKTAYEVPK